MIYGWWMEEPARLYNKEGNAFVEDEYHEADEQPVRYVLVNEQAAAEMAAALATPPSAPPSAPPDTSDAGAQ